MNTYSFGSVSSCAEKIGNLTDPTDIVMNMSNSKTNFRKTFNNTKASLAHISAILATCQRDETTCIAPHHVKRVETLISNTKTNSNDEAASAVKSDNKKNLLIVCGGDSKWFNTIILETNNTNCMKMRSFILQKHTKEIWDHEKEDDYDLEDWRYCRFLLLLLS